MAVAAPANVAALAAHHWGQWEAAIRARDEIALGALGMLLSDMARIWPPDRPTERQLDCLQLLARGCRTIEIAERLGIGTETVHTHLAHAREALRARNSVHAVAIAWRLCLID